MTVTVPSATDEILATWGQSVAYHVNGASITASTASITTSQTQVVGLTIPADSLDAGAQYRLEAWGICTSTGANAVTLRCRIGTTTLTGNIAGSRAPTATATASNDDFKVEFLFTVRTAGATGTCLAQGMTVGKATEPFSAQTVPEVTNSTVVVDTTAENILELTAVTASVNTSVTFRSASIIRVA